MPSDLQIARQAKLRPLREIAAEMGIGELLFETRHVDVNDFLSAVDDLFVIPAGSAAPNPAENLDAAQVRRLQLYMTGNEIEALGPARVSASSGA
jgi:hypothetical protein